MRSNQIDSHTRQKHLLRAILAVYVLLMIRLVVFKYPMEELQQIAAAWDKAVVLEGLDTANFTPFKTIKMYIRYYNRLNSFENLFGNILVFIPFGFLLPYAFHKLKNVLYTFGITLLFVSGIEVFQLFSAFGAFDVDDFILNCFGSILGYMIACCCQTIQKNTSKLY
ncbi:MAG: VanZ family protein [Lachnospiraceae bacterium]|nr:VanZ family protein [Lachnospiraceae bacterium]